MPSDQPTLIAVGDVVRVSHIPSPKMLVVGVIAGGNINCLWFNRRWEAQHANFKVTELFKVIEPARFSSVKEAIEVENTGDYRTGGIPVEEAADAAD